MRIRHTLLPLTLTLATLATLASLAPAAGAQGLRDRLKQRIKEAVAEKGDSAAGSTPDARKPAAQPVEKDAPATTAAPAAAAVPPGQGAWLNYDFVPGDRVVFYEDFTGNEVGDFPRRLRLQEGNLEVVKVQGQPMLRSADGGTFYVVLPEKLPERFTIELKFHSPPHINPIFLATSAETWERSATVGCTASSAFVESHHSGGPDRSGTEAPEEAPRWTDCAFTVDNGRGIKGYVGEHRTANAPQTHVWLGDTLFFQLPGGGSDDPVLLASVRVAAGGRKLYDVLAAKGRVATQGIFFDTGKDVLRPESTPTLTEIGEMLKAHPDLRLAIEGHTDDVGQPAANRALSEQRAAAVKAYLVSSLGVDAARLATAGYGDAKPAAPNTTPEGRQQNRRVELVKQ